MPGVCGVTLLNNELINSTFDFKHFILNTRNSLVIHFKYLYFTLNLKSDCGIYVKIIIFSIWERFCLRKCLATLIKWVGAKEHPVYGGGRYLPPTSYPTIVSNNNPIQQ